METGKAAERLPFLRFTLMLHSARIRFRRSHSAALLALSTTTAFSPAQSASPVFAPSDQYSITLLSPDQMIPVDRTDAEAWQEAIATSAQFFGYTLDSSYTYREIACPVAPNHLILAYEATAANGSISRFTAVVRRSAEEETAGKHASAQIIPILHSGVVPFVRAIANPHSIEVFNAAISPAPSATESLAAALTGSQPLLVRSLCYLALVGEEPAALHLPPAYQATDQVAEATIHAPVPTLAFSKRGQIRQMISVRSSANDYQVWALNFLSGGKLLSASHAEHPIDRTPLVLNANAAAPQSPPGTAPISIVPASGAVSSVLAAPTVTVPASAAPPVRTPAPVASVPVPAPTVPVASTPTLPTPLAPVVTAAGSHQPPSAAVPAPPPSPNRAVKTTDTSAVTQPLTAPPTPSRPTPATVPVAPASKVAAVNAPSAVKPPLPSPSVRVFTNLPPPSSKFIPDSALKTRPPLPQ